MKNMGRLLDLLEARYKKKTRKSLQVYRRAQRVMVQGGSHSLRLFAPYPFFIAKAAGPLVYDLDGQAYIDYWQGHYANILGHNPKVIRQAFAGKDGEDDSLHTGFEGESQIRLAELLLEQLGYKDCKIRFTTSGTLATMYAVMLAQAYTGRDGVLKVGGGWHGASPYLLKGVKFSPSGGFEQVESAGVPREFAREIFITRFNDCEALEKLLYKKGHEVACFLVEPFLGVGGFLAASREYLELARALTEKYGIVLIFDEIISGFRFCPSGVQKLYGIEPDLSTFGKLIGGGHAVSAVAGKSEILEKCRPQAPARMRVLFEGGTFSSHPRYMRAGFAMLKHLVDHGSSVYPRIATIGETLRRRIEGVFAGQGIEVKCTGDGNDVVKGSSLFMVNFPLKKLSYDRAEDVWNPDRSGVRLKEEALKLALLTEGVHVVHGGGAVSAAHEKTHVEQTVSAYEETACLFKKFLY